MNTHNLTPMQSRLPHAVAALALFLTQGLAIAGVNAETQFEQRDAQPREVRSDIYLGSNEPLPDPASMQVMQVTSGSTPETDCIGAAAETADSSNPADRK